MRSRNEIMQTAANTSYAGLTPLILEVLLDIREFVADLGTTEKRQQIMGTD